jgi:beta-glucosidase
VGLDWQLEGEHIHPGDIAPVLRFIPPPQWLEHWLGRRRIQRLWHPVAHAIAWLTSHATPRVRGDFAAGDRCDLSLPPDQLRLIKAVAAVNRRTVVVLMGGGAILCHDWQHLVSGLLLLWYPGEQGGHALAEVLFGDVSPGGRLPFSMPASKQGLPTFEPRAKQVRYDLWHGYRLLQKRGLPALFPFGFGLSYTHFQRSLRAARLISNGAGQRCIRLDLMVRNSGAMAGSEVVQVYLEPPGEGMERPRRSLVGFQRVELMAAEERELSLDIPLQRLACFDPRRDRFVVEAGLHRLVVANHVDDPGDVVNLQLRAEVLNA